MTHTSNHMELPPEILCHLVHFGGLGPSRICIDVYLDDASTEPPASSQKNMPLPCLSVSGRDPLKYEPKTRPCGLSVNKFRAICTIGKQLNVTFKLE